MGNLDIVKMLLKDDRVNISLKLDTALLRATHGGHFEILKLIWKSLKLRLAATLVCWPEPLTPKMPAQFAVAAQLCFVVLEAVS